MRIPVSFHCSILMLPLVAFASAQAGTLYVSTQGNDSYPGTAAQPLRSITHAYSLASAGTTILVLPGVYTDYNTGWGIHLGASGTAASPIILRSQTPGAAVIDGQNAADRNVGFYIDGNYNVVDGFEILNCPNGGITLWANSNQILNCNIHHNGTPASSSTQGKNGVYSSETTSGNIYSANYIHHNGRVGSTLDHGLYLCGKNEVVKNNILVANMGNGIQVAGYTTVSNMRIYNNVIAYHGANGIILWQALSGVDIKNNILYANGHYGISSYAATGSGISVDHNLSFGNASGHFNFTAGGSTYSYTLGSAIYTDPMLANPVASSFDSHVRTGSPAIQSGLNLFSALTTDCTGAPRPSFGAWDLGAYNFGNAVSASPAATLGISKAPNGMALSWNSVAGKTYRVAYKTDLSSATWTDLSANITAAGTSTSWTDTTSAGARQRFYRVYSIN